MAPMTKTKLSKDKTFPREAWIKMLVDAGVSPELTQLLKKERKNRRHVYLKDLVIKAIAILVLSWVAFAVIYSLVSCTPVEAPCRPVDASSLKARCIAAAKTCAPEPAPCPALAACLDEADRRMTLCLQ